MKFNLANPKDILNEAQAPKEITNTKELKERVADVLNQFGVGIERIISVVGSRVILFKIVLSAGTKIAKLRSIQNELAIGLGTESLRLFQMNDCIGIEIPNPYPTIVSLLECMNTDNKKGLQIVLGKNVNGEVKSAMLNEMPHMLVAGATGQGKSVFINTVLVSLLLKMTPDDMKLVLIDPKRVELGLYNKITPYLLKPVITDSLEAIKILKTLCFEMDERYNLLQDAAVRNISEYNDKVSTLNANNGHRHLPFIVTVIDEFADLMLTGGDEAKNSIIRLAQLARAVGIHLIIATQRPSTDIICGLIKANFPVRVAFRTTSNIDSRTILDAGGAEDLLGNGDMLYSKGADLFRIQCPFISTEEVVNLVNHIASQTGVVNEYLLTEI
jgi:S-DNA-T family DNA segregation ATPase FtsK/SpoIIIE